MWLLYWIEVHDTYLKNRKFEQLILRRLVNLKSFIGLFSITQALKDHYIESFSVPEEKVFVVPDGADPISTKSSFAPFQKIPGQIDVGYVGSLYRGRGIEVIIKLASALPMFFFHVVGGNEEDVAMWDCDIKGLPNIRFYGYVPHAETAAYLMHCDVLIAPYQKKIYTGGGSHTEQWASPLKVFEYMSSGRPFICSDIPVFREVLRDRENCFLCAPEDVSAWIAALDFIVNNPHEAALIAAKAKDEFLSQYTWAIRAKNMAEIIINSVDHSKA